jgi:hypothetical protein
MELGVAAPDIRHLRLLITSMNAGCAQHVDVVGTSTFFRSTEIVVPVSANFKTDVLHTQKRLQLSEFLRKNEVKVVIHSAYH